MSSIVLVCPLSTHKLKIPYWFYSTWRPVFCCRVLDSTVPWILW